MPTPSPTSIVAGISKHRPMVAGETFETISAPPNILMLGEHTQHTGYLRDGTKIDAFTTLRIPIDGIPQVFLDEPLLDARLELLTWKRSKSTIKNDNTRGRRQIRKPAGWYHPTSTDNAGGNTADNQFGTRRGTHTNRSQTAITEWSIVGMAEHDYLTLPIGQVLAPWFKEITNVTDSQGNGPINILGSSSISSAATRGKKGYKGNIGLYRHFAFRWAWRKDGKMFTSPISLVVWCGPHRMHPFVPTGNTAGFNSGLVGLYIINPNYVSGKYQLAAGFSRQVVN